MSLEAHNRPALSARPSRMSELDQQPEPLPRLSAVVVAHSRPLPTAACIDSLCAQTERAIEVIVVLNDATRDVAESVERAVARDSRVRAVSCSGVSASEARNYGVAVARGSVLHFVDDDVEVPPDTAAKLLALFSAHGEVCVIGGPNLTPPDDPAFSHLSGEVLASPWGSGLAHVRYSRVRERPAAEQHLILCNLAVKREIFESGLRFPVLFGGEENVLMGRAAHAGHRLLYSPEVWVHHRRRTNWSGYVEQMFRYGRGRALALLYAPGTFHVAYFAPVVLLVYLIGLPALAWVSLWALAPLCVYALGSFVAAGAIALRRRRLGWLPGLITLFALTHIVYAAGLVASLIKPSPPEEANGSRQASEPC
jgi:succinoglycan biosynthesis protein ExoA